MSHASQLRQRLAALTLALVAVVSAHAHGLAATDYTFVALDIQANGTANGINNSGQIVGEYYEPSGGRHGFLLADTLTTIDVPDVRPGSTTVSGINDSGDLVGSFLDPPPARPFPRGFLYHDGFQLFRFEQAVEVLGINNDGYLVGRSCCERGGNPEGFIISPDGSRQFFNVPDSPWDWASGMNALGHIVGSYFVQLSDDVPIDGLMQVDGAYDPTGLTLDAAITFTAFFYQDGEFVRFTVPDAMRTYANGLNDWDQIVGEYWDAMSTSHGFLRDPDGTFTTLDFPGAQSTVVRGINNAGQVVGYYVDGGRAHPFLASPAPMRNTDPER